MANISECLSQLLNARYGKDVRKSIYESILQCYYDASGASLDGVFSFGEMEEISMEAGYIDSNAVPGTAISLSKIESSSWECALLECKEGDRFTLSGTGGNDGRMFCFVDESNKILCASPDNVVYKSVVIEAPKKSKKIILNRSVGDVGTPNYKGSLPGYLFLESVNINNNRFIDINTGSINTDTSVYSSTDFIKVEPNTKYSIYGICLN